MILVKFLGDPRKLTQAKFRGVIALCPLNKSGKNKKTKNFNFLLISDITLLFSFLALSCLYVLFAGVIGVSKAKLNSKIIISKMVKVFDINLYGNF